MSIIFDIMTESALSARKVCFLITGKFIKTHFTVSDTDFGLLLSQILYIRLTIIPASLRTTASASQLTTGKR